MARRNEILAEITAILSDGHPIDPMPAEGVQGWQDTVQQVPRVFILSLVEGLSHVQIAGGLKIPAWIVRRHMLKAIRHIVNARCVRCGKQGCDCRHASGRGAGQKGAAYMSCLRRVAAFMIAYGLVHLAMTAAFTAFLFVYQLIPD